MENIKEVAKNVNLPSSGSIEDFEAALKTARERFPRLPRGKFLNACVMKLRELNHPGVPLSDPRLRYCGAFCPLDSISVALCKENVLSLLDFITKNSV